ncbi:translesion error-prone DNA polymerase V autoproteolytic subunit [Pedobacter sp. JY14-1]|uniref:LexA family protein n=1 Tax=Pedobacter sp. JY14-1 TaxID=3034151 RepID=UPI0023E0D2C2|nr:translesion error-prone DNA polymerase V autoproteolytic subunit [Pedobacter sp. JY14-1]
MKELELYRKGTAPTLAPLYDEAIHAGSESPAVDNKEARIDVNDYVTRYPDATFFARVKGECMIGSGIFPDDLLVVDRSLTPSHGDIVVGVLDNEFILRCYYTVSGKEYLMPDNQYFKPIERTESTHFEIWGVVPHTILDQRRRNHARINRIDSRFRNL